MILVVFHAHVSDDSQIVLNWDVVYCWFFFNIYKHSISYMGRKLASDANVILLAFLLNYYFPKIMLDNGSLKNIFPISFCPFI